MTIAIRFGAGSDVGLLRDGNEDSMYAGPRLLAVADGMGGHAAGEVASRVAIETVAALDLDPPGSDLLTSLRDSVEIANEHLRAMVAADDALEGMGTTLTALLFDARRLGLVHVGDSRAYLLRDGELTQITHDHTLVQNLVDEGRLRPDEVSTHPQRSWITRALDGRGEVEMDLSVREARVGDRYLVCSDGLSGVVSEETMHEALSEPDPQDACNTLIELALRAGGPDNVTCIVADVVDTDNIGRDPIVGGAAADETPSRIIDSPAQRASRLGRHRSPKSTRETTPAPAARPDRGSRRIVLLLCLIGALIVAGVVGTWLYTRTQYYVGVAKGSPSTVGVYRGVSGGILGVDLSSLRKRTDIPVSALPDYEQPRVHNGIDASSRSDANRIVSTLRSEACAQQSTGTPPAWCEASP